MMDEKKTPKGQDFTAKDKDTRTSIITVDDGPKEDAHRDRPRHTDRRQHVLVTNEQRRSLKYCFDVTVLNCFSVR